MKMLRATLLLVIAIAVVSLATAEERILNGEVVQSDTKYPYKCALHHLLNTFQCGCIIISPDFVLTSARCVQVALVRELTVHVGSNHISAGGVNYAVDSKVVHYDFMDNDPFSPDLCILKLLSNMTLDATVGPVTLPTQDEPTPTGAAGVLIGWGYTAASGPYSPNLMEANATIMDHTACYDVYASEGLLTDRHICTTAIGGGVCNGDNGGPLMVNNVLHGITTWTSLECATSQGFPGVYTRAASFRDWIRTQTGI